MEWAGCIFLTQSLAPPDVVIPVIELPVSAKLSFCAPCLRLSKPYESAKQELRQQKGIKKVVSNHVGDDSPLDIK